jgi:hypothetical protein
MKVVRNMAKKTGVTSGDSTQTASKQSANTTQKQTSAANGRKKRASGRKKQVNNSKNNTQFPTPKPTKGRTPKDLFKSVHHNVVGTHNYASTVSPNLVFMLGGGLIIFASSKRIKTVFEYAWGNKTVADASKNPSDFWHNLKVILVQLFFIFLITMSARVIPQLGKMWVIVLIGLWILYMMRNPQIFKLLQVAGQR